MASGKLRHPVTIEKLTGVRDGFGAVTDTWVKFADAWAEVKPVKASEFFASAKENHRVTHRVVIRYIDGVSPAMRVMHEGRALNIVGVRDYFERHAMLELMCEEEDDGR